MKHGTNGTYNGGCRCQPCTKAHRIAARQRNGIVVPPDRDTHLDQPWLILNFPLSIVARKAWPDDNTAITAAYPNGGER